MSSRATGTQVTQLQWKRVVPPVNDDIDDPTIITGSAGNVDLEHAYATRGSNEPPCVAWDRGFDPYEHTVWFQWVADHSDLIEVRANGGAVGLWEVTSSGELLEVRCPPLNSGLLVERVSLGTTYLIGASSSQLLGTGPGATLSWRRLIAVNNDDVTNPAVIEGESGQVDVDLTLSSREPTEPDCDRWSDPNRHRASVWYQWKPPTDFTVALTTDAGQFRFPDLGIWRVAASGDLELVACNFAQTLLANVSSDSTYVIGVVSEQSQFALSELSWAPHEGPANDQIDSPQVIEGSSGTVTVDLNGATPAIDGPDCRVWREELPNAWFEWTAPFDGNLLMRPSQWWGEDLVGIGVWQRNTDDSLTDLDCDWEFEDEDRSPQVTFPTTAGATYLIGVHATDIAGTGELRWDPIGGPPPTPTPTPTPTPPPGGEFFCNGEPATIIGTSGDDELEGTPAPDVIVGLGGNDTIVGLGGDDTICGGSGNDTIRGNGGNDFIDAGPGNDFADGNRGNDHVSGGAGDDTVKGSAGADNLNAGPGNDAVYGGGGNDILRGGPADKPTNDRLGGNNGNDKITTFAGPAKLIGGNGTDQCTTPEPTPQDITTTTCE